MTWAIVFAFTGIVVGLLTNVVSTWIEPRLRRQKALLVALFVMIGLGAGIFLDKDGFKFPGRQFLSKSPEGDTSPATGKSPAPAATVNESACKEVAAQLKTVTDQMIQAGYKRAVHADKVQICRFFSKQESNIGPNVTLRLIQEHAAEVSTCFLKDCEKDGEKDGLNCKELAYTVHDFITLLDQLQKYGCLDT